MNVYWKFTRRKDDGWTWECRRTDGVMVRGSAPQVNIGKLVRDATQHGFDPRQHIWVVEDSKIVTRYAPGTVPEVETRLLAG